MFKILASIQPNSYFLLFKSHTQNIINQIPNRLKYIIVNVCPIKINGVSTGRAPIQVKRIVVLRRIHSVIWFNG